VMKGVMVVVVMVMVVMVVIPSSGGTPSHQRVPLMGPVCLPPLAAPQKAARQKARDEPRPPAEQKQSTRRYTYI